MAMQPHSSFDALARVIEQLGSDGRSVRRAEAVARDGDESLHAEVDVATSIGGSSGTAALEPTSASIDGDELRVSFSTPALSAASPDGPTRSGDRPSVSARPSDARIDDGDVVLTLDVAIGSADAGEAAESPDPVSVDDTERLSDAEESGAIAAHGDREVGADSVSGTETGADAASETDDVESALAAARDESVPPYEDAAYLRRLYDACETFDEMSERIEMDVSGETVRRYMIDAGVHTPASYETSGAESSATNERSRRSADGRDRSSADGRDRSPADEFGTDALPDDQLLADGIGLPDDLALRDVVDAVVEARTVYEVHRRLGVDQDRARRLLKQLNVLDLVLRRVSDEPERSVPYETVTARIRQATPDGV